MDETYLVATLHVVLAEEQHPAHQVGSGHALGPLALLIPARRLHHVVGVRPVRRHRQVVAVNAEVTAVPMEDGNRNSSQENDLAESGDLVPSWHRKKMQVNTVKAFSVSSITVLNLKLYRKYIFAL
jgi:hypothetical protein